MSIPHPTHPARLLLSEAIRQQAADSPERVAVQCRDQRVTYSALETLLAQAGDLRGKRLLLILPDGVAAYLAHVHFFVRGALVVPLSVQTATPRIKALCDRMQPHYVVTSKLLRARHAAALSDTACITIEGERADDFVSALQTAPPPAAARENAAGGDDIRLIFFTSGSTGEPKGVCLSEENVLAAAGMNRAVLGLDATRRSLVTVPLYDYYGFIQIYSHLLAGGGIVLGDSLAFPGQLLQRITDEKITDLILVPHTLRELLRVSAGNSGRDALASLRFMTSSSDVLTPEILSEAFQTNPQLQLFNVYGLTEAGRACFRRIDAHSPASSSIGRPAPGVEIVVDGPPGEPGEIVIRGPNVMRGYFQGLDAPAFYRPCTEMRTGDLGYCEPSGEIVLLGRKDHQFNLKGAKIHPAEIERLVLQVVGVSDALARTAVENGETVIHLDIVPGPDGCDLPAVQKHLRQNLAPQFVPRHVGFVPSIRRTEIGSKIIRQKVPV